MKIVEPFGWKFNKGLCNYFFSHIINKIINIKSFNGMTIHTTNFEIKKNSMQIQFFDDTSMDLWVGRRDKVVKMLC